MIEPAGWRGASDNDVLSGGRGSGPLPEGGGEARSDRWA
ncbi:hypothetical protein J2S51_002798 [Streptomyces sp. DSM 41269]|nr:hypothetical protein [Streptomyces sp. DSM 41269]